MLAFYTSHAILQTLKKKQVSINVDVGHQREQH